MSMASIVANMKAVAAYTAAVTSHLRTVGNLVVGVGTGMWKVGVAAKNVAEYLRTSALNAGDMVSTASLTAAKDYGGVFKQVNFDLAHRNELNMQGLRNLQLTNAEIGDAALQTATYGFDLRMAKEDWFTIADTIAKTSYSIGASTAELAKLANVTNLLGGDFKEISGFMIDVVGKTSLAGDEVADMAAELSKMNLLFGKGEALTRGSLVTLSKMADRLKQAGGSAKELVTAISGANARFTSAAGFGFLPGFATDKMGVGMKRYEVMLGGFSKMIMAQNAVVRGTLADAFGPLFNLSGDAMLQFAVDATAKLSPLEIQARDVNKVWTEMTQSMGESWDRCWDRIFKTSQPATFLILTSINKLIAKFNNMFDAGLGNKISKWLEGAGSKVASWIDDFAEHFDERMEEAGEALKGFWEGTLRPWLTWVGDGFKKLWGFVKNPWDWKTILGVGVVVTLLALLPGFSTALAGLGIALLGVGYATEQLGQNGDKAYEVLARFWNAFNGWGFTGLLTGVTIGIFGLTAAIDAAIPGVLALTALVASVGLTIGTVVDALDRLEKLDGDKLAHVGGGLVHIGKGLGVIATAMAGSGIAGLITSTSSTEYAMKQLKWYADCGPAFQRAGNGLAALSAGIKAMPAKFEFEFSDASFQSARRLRDAVTVIDGGNFALQRTVSLFERLDLVLRSLSMAKEFRLPSVTEALDLLYKQAGTTMRALTAVSAPPSNVTSNATPTTTAARPLETSRSSTIGNVFTGVVEAIERQTKLIEEQARAEKERAVANAELERSNTTIRAQADAARTPVTTPR